MKDLLEYIVKNLVSNPDSAMVEEDNQDGNVNLYLTVHPDDMGIIIGKGGQTIHAIRKILTVRAIAENVRINLQLNEPESSRHSAGDSEQSKTENTEAKVEEKPEEVEQEPEKTEEAEPKEKEHEESKSEE